VVITIDTNTQLPAQPQVQELTIIDVMLLEEDMLLLPPPLLLANTTSTTAQPHLPLPLL